MITKLTADNAELYYAPRFAEITAAFQAAGQDIEIKSLEDYFIYLPEIAALEVGAKNVPNAYLLVAPADEDIFTIDANTRAISVPAFVKKNGIGVYGDHRAEMIVMTIDRYFDHEDFLNDKIVINWNFTPMGAKSPRIENQAAAAFAPNEELNPGLITFGFIITKDMTPEKGTLTFSVTIYDELSNDIVYSFNTLTAQVIINDTLTLEKGTVIKNDTDNYVGRLVGSVYTDNTIAPVDEPVWKSGEALGDGLFSGLESVAYFDSAEDLANNYVNGAILTAYAISDNSNNIRYQWTFSPVDGTIETARQFETVNKATDYVEVPEVIDYGPNFYYYKKDSLGQIDVSNPMTYAVAKELQDSQGSAGTFLPLKVKVVPSDAINSELTDARFNQAHSLMNVSGNKVLFHSNEELISFDSTDPGQQALGPAQWVAFDIDTGLPTILGVRWNGYELGQVDIDEAESIGLGAGHIVFWARANAIMADERVISLSADGYNPTTIRFQYTGVNSDPSREGYLNIVNDAERITFLVRGSSFQAFSAGNYQVIAQARIDAGERYEKVLDGADLVVNKEYFVGSDGNVDSLNPLTNEAAAAARENGSELYVRLGAARNSAPVESSVLVVPAALQPSVVLSVASQIDLEDDEEVIDAPGYEGLAKNLDFVGPEYVYIDSNVIPVIIATVTLDTDNNEDLAGAFAAELVKESDPALDLATIEQKIADHKLTFVPYPTNQQFEFSMERPEEDTYVVRAINRRNGTYSVSENSDSITTKFVAPAISNIDVNAVFSDSQPIPALVGGQWPNNEIKEFEFNRTRRSYDFEIVDNSDNLPDAVVSYYIEECIYDPETGARSFGPDETDEFGNEENLREIEVIQDENQNNVYRFSITNDPGYYRIKTVNKYYGTINVAYTNVFRVYT